MKDSFMYPLIFMLIIIVIFVGILAIMYRSSEAKIEAYKRDSYQKMVLRVLSSEIANATSRDAEEVAQDYPASYNEYVKEINKSGLNRRIFASVVDAKVLGYCFEIGGKGLWGTMKALVSTTTDLTTIIDFAIVDQMETPGLGARIEEEWFLSQFRGKIIVQRPDDADDVTIPYEFIAETLSPENDLQLRRVTGATITSDSVLRMLRTEFNYIYSFFRENSL